MQFENLNHIKNNIVRSDFIKNIRLQLAAYIPNMDFVGEFVKEISTDTPDLPTAFKELVHYITSTTLQ